MPVSISFRTEPKYVVQYYYFWYHAHPWAPRPRPPPLTPDREFIGTREARDGGTLSRMDGWMDYTSLCIDHGPLAGGISATRGGDYPYLLIILEVPSYLQIIRFCMIILICLCSRVDGDSYVLDVQAVEACNSLSRMLFLTIPGMYREG